MHNKNNLLRRTLSGQNFPLVGLVAAIALGSGQAQGGETIEFENGASLDWAITGSYGLGVRTEGQASALIDGDQTINSDDGDRNFDKGSLVNNSVGAIAELILRKDDYGAVLRGSTFYDAAYHGANDNDAPERVNKFGDVNAFTSDTKYYAGGRSRFLDAYVFKGWASEDGQRLDVKAGEHVVAWGDSLLFPGVSGAQLPVDVVKASLPGVETKDVLLPVGQVSGLWTINDMFALGAYVQYEWTGNELPPVGSYLSTTDVIGPGRELIKAGPFNILYGGTDNPRSSGQWGLQVRFQPIDDLELSLFRINYHDRNPSGVDFSFQPDGSMHYQVNYFEDIHLTGLSFSTRLGDTQVSGEWSYRDGAPIQVTTPDGTTAAKGKGQQMQVSFMRILGARPWANQTTVLGEIVHVRADSVEDVNGFDDFTFKGDGEWQSQTSTAYSAVAILSYPGVATGWDLDVPFRFSQVLEGSTPMSGAISGAQGDRRLSVGTTFKYLGNMQIELSYNAFLGDADPVKRQLADRDYATLSVKYSL